MSATPRPWTMFQLHPLSLEDAKFIFRAVNAHDALVGAAWELIGLAEGLTEDDPWFGHQRGATGILERARALLDSLKPGPTPAELQRQYFDCIRPGDPDDGPDEETPSA